MNTNILNNTQEIEPYKMAIATNRYRLINKTSKNSSTRTHYNEMETIIDHLITNLNPNKVTTLIKVETQPTDH